MPISQSRTVSAFKRRRRIRDIQFYADNYAIKAIIKLASGEFALRLKRHGSMYAVALYSSITAFDNSFAEVFDYFCEWNDSPELCYDATCAFLSSRRESQESNKQESIGKVHCARF